MLKDVVALSPGDRCAEYGASVGYWTVQEYVTHARSLRIGISFNKYKNVE